jgi:hypothetical protein
VFNLATQLINKGYDLERILGELDSKKSSEFLALLLPIPVSGCAFFWRSDLYATASENAHRELWWLDNIKVTANWPKLS